MTEHFKHVLLKGLDNLASELLEFTNEKDLWLVKQGISNSAGNLTLHLIGNLNHFIGAQLGHTGYIREREKEFSDKNIPVAVLIKHIDSTKEMLTETFSHLTNNDLTNIFPLNTFGENKTVHEVLIILTGHLNYHLGQINYYRRLN